MTAAGKGILKGMEYAPVSKVSPCVPMHSICIHVVCMPRPPHRARWRAREQRGQPQTKRLCVPPMPRQG